MFVYDRHRSFHGFNLSDHFEQPGASKFCIDKALKIIKHLSAEVCHNKMLGKNHIKTEYIGNKAFSKSSV